MKFGVSPNLLKVTTTVLFIIACHALTAQQVAKQTSQGIWFYEYLPPDYSTNTNKYPVVFFLHGIGERGNNEAELARVLNAGPPRMIKNGWRPNFIMVSPQLKSAYGGWPNVYIDNVIEHYKSINPRIDLTRIYLIGLSLGGGGVWQYSQEANYGQKLAAIVPVCGSGNSPAKACNFGITNLPVWAHHGDADNVVSVTKSINMVNAINECNPAPNPLAKLSIYPGINHNSWDIAFKNDHTYHNPNVWEWLMQFKNGTTVANAGADKTIYLPTNSTTLTGSGTVENSTITSYAWSKISGPAGTLTNTNTATLSLSNLGEGIHIFRLIVKAGNGEMAQDEVKLTVIGSNVGPTANAGPDRAITLPTNSITITGSGTDSDGTIVGYAWAKKSGPSVSESGKTTATLKLTNMVAGTYVYTLTVTDNIGYTASDEMRIVVNAVNTNQPPTVNAGSDRTINLPANSANLTATASDADGSISAYLWEKVSGPTVTMTNTTSATVNLTNLVAGAYVFRATATDNAGAKGADDVKVTVVAANQAPVANAGADITITLPTNSTNINGSGSDADGTVTAYAWSFVSGPNTPNIANAAATTVSVSALVQGTYTFRLTVTDNSGATSLDEVKVIVNPAIVNNPPTANAGGDKLINLPTNNASLVGSGSDSDGSISAYAWTKMSGPSVTMSNTNASTLLISNLVAGVYKFQLMVTDNQGATATAVATITVEAANQSPTANAGADATITLPTNTIVLAGAGSDPDGSISSYQWEKVSGPAAGTLSNAATPTLTVSGMTEGVYTFTLTVTDDKGFSDSDEVIVTVNAVQVNTPPVANAGIDKSISLPQTTTSLNGGGSDADGTIAAFQWILVNGPSCVLSGQATATLTVSGLQAGSYIFRLTVTDNGGATHSDEVTLTVQPAAVNQAPVANAGSDISLTLPTNITTITGIGSDADGTIASYGWVKLTGPAATLSGESSSTLSVSGLVAGVYTFELTVTDDLGSTGSDVVTVSVSASNIAPVANAGPDITLNLPENSTPIAGAGTDADGTIQSYVWSQISGPSSATLTGINAATLTVSNLLQGTYVFRLTVADDDGANHFDEVKVVVNAANLAPTASAGPDKSITLPTSSATFNGSGTDSDGTIATYAWSQVSGTSATLSNQNTPVLTVSVPGSGTYTFRLTVTDNEGTTAFDDVQLTVNEAVVNQAPIANAGSNKNITLPVNAVTLSGSGTDTDGSITAYQWTKVSGPAATLANATTPTLSLSALVEGTYLFRLTVTDNGGKTGSAEVTVTVLPAVVNAAPVANAGPDHNLTLPTNSLNIDGSASDNDGTIVSYTWTKVSGPSATITNSTSPLVSIGDLIEGTYIFRLTVVDDDGASSTDDVRVVVNAAMTNQAPVANAGADRNITLPVNSLILTGTASDADGTITQYVWSKLSGPTVTMSGSTTATLTVADLVEGTYVFRLRVSDDDGAVGADDIKITVMAASVNQSPIADAGSDKIITLPVDAITLFGSGSDPDGSITGYLWTKQSGPSATLTNTSNPTLSISDLLAGTYVFRLTVTDDDGSIDSDDMIIIVNPESTNEVPVANAGTDQTVTLPTTMATLNGSGSDADGSIDAYLWVKVSGPSVTITGATNAVLSLSDLVEGTYVFRLTVEDNDGATASDETTVTVLPASLNSAPVVQAGNTITVFAPATTAELDGSASDTDGTVVSVAWTQVAGPSCTITTPNSFFSQVTGLTVGTFRFRLTATDDDGATAFDEVEVVVEPETVNQPPSANAGADQTIKLPVNTTEISGSGTDADGSISAYQWTKVSGPTVSLSGETTETIILTNLVEGNYIFRLTVSDDEGALAEDLIEISVVPAGTNLSPSANAGSDRGLELPENSITLTGSVSDDDPGLTILWEQLEGPPVTLSNANQAEVTVSGFVEGTFAFRLTVTDAGGLTAVDEITVTVFAEADPLGPPVVSAGDDVQIQLPVNSVSIPAEANAPDGLIVAYQWTQLSGTVANIDRPDSSVLVLNQLIPGRYTFSVTVTDNADRQASDEVAITVLDENPLVKPRNLFSPDLRGDSSTETWAIDGAELIEDCEIKVYDRQGQMVFSSLGYPVPWDGTYNGKAVPDGAYFYVIRCSGKITKSGSVTIARIK